MDGFSLSHPGPLIIENWLSCSARGSGGLVAESCAALVTLWTIA